MTILKKKKVLTLILSVSLTMITCGNVFAGTLEDILADLEENADDVNDISANLVIDADDNEYDITSGWVKAKDQATVGTGKFRIHRSQPATGDLYCDGSDVEQVGDSSQCTRTSFVTTNYLGWLSRAFRDCDILWILDNYTFSLYGSNVNVNGTTCKKITSSGYDIYVDINNYKKTIRIEAKESGNVKRRYTMSNISLVENTSYIASNVEATDSPGDNTVTYDITYSNIDINENLDDSYFALP